MIHSRLAKFMGKPDFKMRSQNWGKVMSFLAKFTLASKLLPTRTVALLLMYGIIAEGRTMVSQQRLKNLYRICSDPSLPDGSFVECGVGRGGCIALMSFLSRGKRAVWGFDSFEGMPELTEKDEGDGREWVGFKCSGPNGLREAQITLDRFHVSGEWVTLVPGWFEETLPHYVSQLAPIAVLRLDNDWYQSTRYCLESLYEAVIPGGFVIIDDYYTFKGCKKAVDEFRERRGIQDSLVTTEAASEAYWRRTAACWDRDPNMQPFPMPS